MAWSESTDGGKTWSVSEPYGFPGHAPYLHRTLDDVLLLAHRLPNTSLHYSLDEGKTWSDSLIDIEPADGPEASWVMPLVTPSGRVYAFYDYNGDRIDRLGDKDGLRADMLGWYVYRYSDDGGRTWSRKRHRLPVRVTACDRGNDWEGKVQIFWGIGKPIADYRVRASQDCYLVAWRRDPAFRCQCW